MITFPLREAMCNGVMPFWKEGQTVRTRILLGGEGQLPCTPHSRAPTPRQAASLSPLLGLFSPKKDFQASKDRPASWFITASWPGWVSWGVNNTGGNLLETHSPGALIDSRLSHPPCEDVLSATRGGGTGF